MNSDVIARVLLNDFICNDALDFKSYLSYFHPAENTSALYQAKMRLYRIALVIIALMNEEQSNGKLADVRKSLESLVFNMPQEEGTAFLLEIRNAMRTLRNLLFSKEQPRELSWAREWLQEINVEESNPVSLTLFASHWMNCYVTVVKSLRELISKGV